MWIPLAMWKCLFLIFFPKISVCPIQIRWSHQHILRALNFQFKMAASANGRTARLGGNKMGQVYSQVFHPLCITFRLIKLLISPYIIYVYYVFTYTCLNISKAWSGINYILKKCLRSARHTLFKTGDVAKEQEKQRSAVSESWWGLTCVFSL